MRAKRAKPMPFSKLIVSLVIVLNVLFACAVLYIVWRGAQEPQALVVAWFAFTTAELWALAFIRRGEQNATRQSDTE